MQAIALAEMEDQPELVLLGSIALAQDRDHVLVISSRSQESLGLGDAAIQSQGKEM